MDAKIFQKYLKDIVFKKKESDAKKFDALLRENGALVAGGSVLSQYAPKRFESSDCDIYVSKKNAKTFVQGILGMKKMAKRVLVSGGTYDRSFLSKNNISYMLRLTPIYIHKKGEAQDKIFDIMITKTEPIDVVKNFDLTCCQIWYDGTNVNSTHNVQDKNCELRKDYHTEWILGNRFLKRRVDKYIQRGFIIKIDIDVNDVKDALEKPLSSRKTIVNYEEFFLKFAYQCPSYIESEHWYINIDCLLDLVGERVTFDEMCQLIKTKSPEGYKSLCTFWRGFWIYLKYFEWHKNSVDFVEQFEAGVCQYDNGDSLRKYRIAFFTLMVSYYRYNNNNSWEEYAETKPVFHAKHPDDKECLREVCNVESIQIIAQSQKQFDLPNTVIDVFMQEQMTVSHQDQSRFVFHAPDGPFTLTREAFMTLVIDINNWMYECIGDIFQNGIDRRLPPNLDMIYVKFPVDAKGRNSIFRIDNIYELLSASNCVFEIRETGLSLTHTMSFAQYNSDNPTFVSVNHCQYGSKMDIMEFVEIPKYRFVSSVEISPLASENSALSVYGSGNKKKDYTCVGKRVVMGRERNIYKKPSDRKLFVSYKKDYMPIKEYKKLMAATK